MSAGFGCRHGFSHYHILLQLETLELDHNNFSGTLPSRWWNITKASHYNLSAPAMQLPDIKTCETQSCLQQLQISKLMAA